MTLANYQKELRRMTKSQLIKKCKKLKLSSNGTKMQMIDRLMKKKQEKRKQKAKKAPKSILPHKEFIKYTPHYDANNETQTQFIEQDSLRHDTIYQNGSFLLYQFYNATIYQCNFKQKNWDIFAKIPFSMHVYQIFIGINSKKDSLFFYHHIPNEKEDEITQHNAGYILKYNINTKEWNKSIEIGHKNLTDVYRRLSNPVITIHDTIHVLTIRFRKQKTMFDHVVWDTEANKVIKCKPCAFTAHFDPRTFHYDAIYHRLILIGTDWQNRKLIVYVGQLSYDNRIKCKWNKEPFKFPSTVDVTHSAKNNLFYVSGSILLCFCWSDERIYCLDWSMAQSACKSDTEWIELRYKFPINAFKGKLKKEDMRSIYSLVSITLSPDLRNVYFIQPFDKDSWGKYNTFNYVVSVKDLIPNQLKMRTYNLINGYFIVSLALFSAYGLDAKYNQYLPFEIIQLISAFVFM